MLLFKSLFSLYLIFYGYDGEYFIPEKTGYTDVLISFQASVNIPLNEYATFHAGIIGTEPYAEKFVATPYLNIDFKLKNSLFEIGNLGIGLGKKLAILPEEVIDYGLFSSLMAKDGAWYKYYYNNFSFNSWFLWTQRETVTLQEHFIGGLLSEYKLKYKEISLDTKVFFNISHYGGQFYNNGPVIQSTNPGAEVKFRIGNFFILSRGILSQVRNQFGVANGFGSVYSFGFNKYNFLFSLNYWKNNNYYALEEDTIFKRNEVYFTKLVFSKELIYNSNIKTDLRVDYSDNDWGGYLGIYLEYKL